MLPRRFNNAAAHCSPPQASLGSVYDPRCCIATPGIDVQVRARRTPCIHPVQLTDGNACACMLPAAVVLLSSRKASLLQPGPQASMRRLKRFAGWHETRLGFAPRELILACHPHPGERKPNPPPGVVCKIRTKASVSGTRCPCRRRGVLRSPRLQSALLPLCRRGRPLA